MLLKDGVRCHPKVLTAGAEAAWLWVCCIDYSRQQLTNGFVPDAALPTLAACRMKLPDLVARLVAVRLLEPAEGGVRVHDYLEHNDSADRVRSDREAAAARQSAHRARKAAVTSPQANGDVTSESQRDGHVTVTSPSRARVGVGVCVGNSVVTGIAEDPDARAPSTPILGGQHGHRNHALCGRVCMPAFVYSELVRKRGGDEQAARRYVDEWFIACTKAIPETQVISESEPDYWRRRWAADHAPSVSTAPKVAKFDIAAWVDKEARA